MVGGASGCLPTASSSASCGGLECTRSCAVYGAPTRRGWAAGRCWTTSSSARCDLGRMRRDGRQSCVPRAVAALRAMSASSPLQGR
eukprot:2639069-Prymnesium_polylepis.1